MSEEGSDCGEDAPLRRKPRIRPAAILSSSSGSDSDESVSGVVSRRKRLRVVSDSYSSDSSSGSSVAARRRRKLPKLRDSEAESDFSASGSDHSTAGRALTAVRPTSGFASDSSEGNSDKCSICLLRFTDQQIGTPENCEHVFCLDCITEWSRNVNTCPVDRATFKSIIVRACLGGRVLRTEPVTVVERPPSVEALVIEDPTPCEICRSTSNEEVMLLCDSCDLGYHMHCLTPALTEIPVNQWFCPGCSSPSHSVDVGEMGEVPLTNLERMLMEHGPGRIFIGIMRNQGLENEPSTSSGRRGSIRNTNELPSTSRGSRSSHGAAGTSSVRRRTGGTQRRRTRRRQTRTVIVEYEVKENGKFPVTKRVKRKLKRRKTKKRPRTVARRSHVRASVRAKLASQRGETGAEVAGPAGGDAGRHTLAVHRQRAGIPSLNLFGDPHQLEYFSDDENDISEGATAAVAARPTSSILDAYRQARRKLVSIASPPHAASAPDILSNILESQTLLHSKNSVVSISVDGNVNIKLQNTKRSQPSKLDDHGGNKKEDVNSKKEDRLDLNKAEDSSRKAPSYPGQSRGGGWGGGYRGNYHRDQTSNDFNRSGNYDNYSAGGAGGAGNGGGGYQGRQGQGHPYGYQNNSMRREEPDSFGTYTRRPHQYSQNDDNYDRSRRPITMDNNRGPNYTNPNLPRMNDQNQGRYSLGPSWQPYATSAPGSRGEALPSHARHSFSGFENPLDMRMGQPPPVISSSNAVDMYPGIQASRQEKPQPQAYGPLPEPPNFNFDKMGELDKSEDERSDSGLVIDTEKYDPTEPTNDDDSGDEDKLVAVPRASEPPPALPQPSPPHAAVQSILAGIDTSTMNVPHNILDSAVRQVLQEHRNLMVPTNADSRQDKSDEESDGDCPNFSIYSATSVHIANNSNSLTEELSKPPPEDNLEDLVQEDDETPPPEVASPCNSLSTENNIQIHEDKKEVVYNKSLLSDIKKKTEEEYKEKVSKRCPITTNTRNPIKIKLNTPSLMKRTVSLYDDDDVADDIITTEKSEPAIQEDKSKARTPSPVRKNNIKTPVEEKNDTSVQKVEKEESNVNEDLENNKEENRKEETELKNVPEVKEQLMNDTSDNNDYQKGEKNDKNDTKETSDTEASDNSLVDKDYNEASETEEKPEEDHSETENNDHSENELALKSPKKDDDDEKDNVEKMTESISETEDERSYTPCLDENKSKDNSFETEKEKGIQGLDTEMISEDEGNEMFSESERPPSPAPRASPPRPAADGEEGEILDKKTKEEAKKPAREEGKKKKKKDSKKEGKDKVKSKKKSDIAFKKLSKSGKERNYRERDKDEKRSKKERRDSGESAEERQRRRREKRKDLARYDVRSVVTEKRKKTKDPFGRDISPRARSPSMSRSPPPLSRSGTPPRPARSPPRRRSSSRGPPSPFPRARPSPSPHTATPHASPRRSASTKRRSPAKKRRRSASPRRRGSPRRRRSASRGRKRRRSASRSPKPKPAKKKKRARSERPPSRRRQKTPKRRRRPASRSPRPSPRPSPPRADWTPPSVDSRLLSPRTPPPEPSPERRPPPEEERRERRRRDPERRKRGRDAPGPSKEVFASGDNILVSVSFEEREREEGERRRRRDGKRAARKRRRAPPPVEAAAKPVAIIDLDRSPFRELTPSPENVIVLSDSDRGEPDAPPPPAPAPEPAPEHPTVGPKTPPEPTRTEPAPEPPAPEPRSPDAYDPFEPTRSGSASPASPGSPRSPSSPCAPRSPPPAPSPPRALMTLEAAQKTNMSADEVLDRRPLSPMEKVLALLQSTRDVSPEPPPEPSAEPAPPAHAAPPPPAPRIVLPSPTRAPPKLFPGKPSPIKSNPVKPMQQTAGVRRADDGDSPYSPGSSDFGDLFEPPAKPPAKLSTFDALFDKPRRKGKAAAAAAAAKVPVKLNKKKGKTQVGVKIDEDNLKILDDLPSSAVEMQVKSKFLKKLNRQERVVEEVKLVLKPHYNKKHVTKDEYKDILRRAVPKICHNKTGEINPTKIQALVEAYVKKFRKKHKLGLA